MKSYDGISKIAFGGGCHWCTEAVFQCIKGVENVEQGYVASTEENSNFSEAVIVHFNTDCVKLKTLIEIHLLTHKSASNHSMRSKYRSAIYTFHDSQNQEALDFMTYFKINNSQTYITEVLPFAHFNPSRKDITNYYFNNPNKPFCQTFIDPKLKLLLQKFSKFLQPEKVDHLQKKDNSVVLK